MKKPVTYLLLTLVFISGLSLGQDAHFTQLFHTGSSWNPSAAGQKVEHIRATMLYRNQWASVSSPFTTQALFFDKAVNRAGLGFNVINNSAGESGIRQLQANGNLAYTINVRKSRFTGGVQLGFIHKSFDPSKMTFDDQYVPDQGFIATNPTAETFSYTKLTRPDFGAGIYWSREPGDKIQPWAGAGVQHLNQPRESFILEDNVHPRKFNIQAGTDIHISEHLTLTPWVYLSQQAMAREMVFGTLLKIPMQDRNNFTCGLIYRANDAAAIYTGYQWNSLAAGISYDVNISGVTGGPGAVELTLTYIPKAKEKKETPAKKEKEKKEKTTPVADSKTKEIKGEKPAKEKVKPETTENPEAETKKATPEKSTVVKPADTDKDGIQDTEDECIYSKGSVATKGCPDSDSDGVADKYDNCPMQKGPGNNKGCPVNEPGVSETAGTIQFKTNSDEVKGIIRLEVIEPILDDLYEHPEWKLVISGHTDSEGSDLYNMDLSQRRADAIRAIFIRKGLDESRITTICHGETKPLDDNRSEEGKAANRRAEIHILK